MLDAAERLDDLMSPPANRLERLRGSREGQHSIRVNDQWRYVLFGAMERRTTSRSSIIIEQEDLMEKTRKSAKLPPIHPGEILREEFMLPLGMSINKLARDLHVPVTRVADIVHERRGISSDTALRLGRYFRTTPRFWMNLQAAHDLDVSER